MIQRQKTKCIHVGDQSMGGDAKILIQSMTNTDTADAEATAAQINRLEKAGCDLVRISVYNQASAEAIPIIRKKTNIPLVADIHFDYRLAMQAIENGVDKLRINPGNIGDERKVRALVDCAKSAHIPIRIGVNAGSLEKDILARYGAPTSEALVESALRHVRILEREGFDDIVVSIKASDVVRTVEANRLLSKQIDYPLHVGVTEAGLGAMAMVKSSMGIGSLLLEGIGDTIRISITGDPVQEVEAGWNILRALGLRQRGAEIISCPTCGRTGPFDLADIVESIEQQLPAITKPIKIAVMGCVVNGPGEASEADVGLAFAVDQCVLFANGEKKAILKREEGIPALLAEVEQWMRVTEE